MNGLGSPGANDGHGLGSPQAIDVRAGYPPDRRASPHPLKVLAQGWPILASVFAALIGMFMQWADLRRDMGVIERRLMENDRRVANLEAIDAANAALMTELKVSLAEIKAEIRALRIEMEIGPPPRSQRRRAESLQ